MEHVMPKYAPNIAPMAINPQAPIYPVAPAYVNPGPMPAAPYYENISMVENVHIKPVAYHCPPPRPLVAPTSAAAILVLFILLVIVSRPGALGFAR